MSCMKSAFAQGLGDTFLHSVEAQAAAGTGIAPGCFGEKLGAGQIDKVNSTGHQQQMLLRGSRFSDLLQFVAEDGILRRRK